MDISSSRSNGAATRSNLSACIAALLASSAPAYAVTTAGVMPDGPVVRAFRASVATGASKATRVTGASAVDEADLAPSQLAGEVVVTSCEDDGGFDTLRHAVLVANTGDTVNLSGLACSTITLQSGAIGVGLADLTILGPGAGKLTIDGAGADRVFKHFGAGTLAVNDLTVAHGTFAADKAYGGCIYSMGNVSLNRSVVTSCAALGQTISAGGGILALGTLSTQLSSISDNIASTEAGTAAMLSAVGGGAFGKSVRLIRSVVSGNTAHAATGKVYAGGLAGVTALTIKYSTINDNVATTLGDLANYSSGGGVFGTGATAIIGSTIDHNTADAAAGLQLHGYTSNTASITMTTISSNTGVLGIAAVLSEGPVSMQGCTIAFNTSGSVASAAVVLSDAATMHSTIIADNSPIDLIAPTVTGGKNLIKIITQGTIVPMDTKTQDPNLQPLALNGGPTRTHALGPGSPAINNGSNVPNNAYDQRGPTYRRVVGAAADIGAYEVDTDHIFGTSIDFPLAF